MPKTESPKNGVLVLSQVKHPTSSLIRLFKDPGFIYIATNKSLKQHYIKIGMTRDLPSKRVRELSRQTAIPTPFALKCVFEAHNCVELESSIHKILKKYRVSKNKEFFEIPWYGAVEEVLKNFEMHKVEIIDTWPMRSRMKKMEVEMQKLKF